MKTYEPITEELQRTTEEEDESICYGVEYSGPLGQHWCGARIAKPISPEVASFAKDQTAQVMARAIASKKETGEWPDYSNPVQSSRVYGGAKNGEVLANFAKTHPKAA